MKKNVDQLLTTIKGENVSFKRNSIQKAGNEKVSEKKELKYFTKNMWIAHQKGGRLNQKLSCAFIGIGNYKVNSQKRSNAQS